MQHPTYAVGANIQGFKPLCGDGPSLGAQGRAAPSAGGHLQCSSLCAHPLRAVGKGFLVFDQRLGKGFYVCVSQQHFAGALEDEDFGWRLRIITQGEGDLGWFIVAVIQVLTPQN